MSTRLVLGAVGAAIGGFFFGPQGAQWGFAIGSAVGGAVDPETIKGPSVGDIAAQTSQEGVPRPIVFALSQPIAGNIIASSEPRIVRKRQRQGKGGPKVETESVFRTYAIGVCEGPITRFVRIWRNGQLVYDADDEVMEEELELTFFNIVQAINSENAHFLEHARFFLGGWDQEPSPDLETFLGVGTTPAHRGTAYMVMADEDLTDLRGAIPQYQFQVERCEGVFLTSRPYPLNDIAPIAAEFPEMHEQILPDLIERVDQTYSFVSGELNDILRTYDDADPEAIEVTGFSFVSGVTNETIFSTYEGDPEAVDITGFDFVAGALDEILIRYEDGDPEAVDAAFSFVSGVLS